MDARDSELQLLARYGQNDCVMKVGLRNYLFIGHPAADWRSAVVYSVVATCKLLGVNRENYIAWVLPKLAAATNKTATRLLPHDFAQLSRSDVVDDATHYE